MDSGLFVVVCCVLVVGLRFSIALSPLPFVSCIQVRCPHGPVVCVVVVVVVVVVEVRAVVVVVVVAVVLRLVVGRLFVVALMLSMFSVVVGCRRLPHAMRTCRPCSSDMVMVLLVLLWLLSLLWLLVVVVVLVVLARWLSRHSRLRPQRGPHVISNCFP